MGPPMFRALSTTLRVGRKLPRSWVSFISLLPKTRKENMAMPVITSATPLPSFRLLSGQWTTVTPRSLSRALSSGVSQTPWAA